MIEQVYNFIETPNGKKIIGITVALIVLWFIANIIKRIIPKYINTKQTRYRSRKVY